MARALRGILCGVVKQLSCGIALIKHASSFALWPASAHGAICLALGLLAFGNALCARNDGLWEVVCAGFYCWICLWCEFCIQCVIKRPVEIVAYCWLCLASFSRASLATTRDRFAASFNRSLRALSGSRNIFFSVSCAIFRCCAALYFIRGILKERDVA